MNGEFYVTVHGFSSFVPYNWSFINGHTFVEFCLMDAKDRRIAEQDQEIAELKAEVAGLRSLVAALEKTPATLPNLRLPTSLNHPNNKTADARKRSAVKKDTSKTFALPFPTIKSTRPSHSNSTPVPSAAEHSKLLTQSPRNISKSNWSKNRSSSPNTTNTGANTVNAIIIDLLISSKHDTMTSS